MIRTKGEAGTGNVVEAVRHQHDIMGAIRELKNKNDEELQTTARKIEAPFEVVKEVADLQRLPVINFAAGGIATPADAAMMMQLGSDGVFVGSGIFKASDPVPRAKAIVEAVTHFDDPKVIAEVSKGLGNAMKGLEITEIPEDQRLQERGW
jgi:pyridoxal 5'-phosphate synthase pdxS subunit